MTDVKLKPCAHCGHTKPSIEYVDGLERREDGAHEVCCGKCQAYCWGETRAEAIECWNRRPGIAVQPVEIVVNRNQDPGRVARKVLDALERTQVSRPRREMRSVVAVAIGACVGAFFVLAHFLGWF